MLRASILSAIVFIFLISCQVTATRTSKNSKEKSCNVPSGFALCAEYVTAICNKGAKCEGFEPLECKKALVPGCVNAVEVSEEGADILYKKCIPDIARQACDDNQIPASCLSIK